MDTNGEKWAFRLTFGVFFVTLATVLAAVVFSCIYLIRDTPTVSDLAKTEAKIDTLTEKMDERLIRIEFILLDLKQDVNKNMIDHLQTAHVSKP